ncbi:MAG: hypothetical protein HZB92_07250 [Euryarchaeota archaeon]|nr:hypothetical protein [Euryarchaeota archaeon]
MQKGKMTTVGVEGSQGTFIAGHRIDFMETEHILLSHECVLEANVSTVQGKGNNELLLAVVTLKKGYAPSNDLKTELAWLVSTDLGITSLFKDIEFRKPKSENPKTQIVETNEEGGEVHISGHKIYISEVVRVLMSHKEVVKAKVTGVLDNRSGELLKAVVVLKEGCAPSNDMKLELAWYARTKIGPMALFKDIEFRDSLDEEEDENRNLQGIGKTQKGMVIVDKVEKDDREIHIFSHRISTREVTKALLSHPDVTDAAAVTVPDDTKGFVIKAFVKLKDGIAPSNDLKLELAWHVMVELKPIATFKDIELEAPGNNLPLEYIKNGGWEDAVDISGHTVLSVDVEKALARHEAVSDALVFGVPDEKLGEALQAFVTLKDGVMPSDELKEELAWRARTEIGPQVIFKSINFRRFLPKTSRTILKSILLADALAIPAKMSISIAD